MALGAQPTLSQSSATQSASKKKTEAENVWATKENFNSPYTPQVQQSYQNIIDRQPFTYDFNADPVYQGLRDRYVNAGNMANYNTQAQAAATTSGYGNSYAQTAGYQAMSQQLDNLMNQIPELAEQNLNRYNRETQQMYDQFNLLNNLEKQDYTRYRDTVSDIYNDLLYYQGEYQYMNDQDFNYYKNNLDKWLSDRDYYYQQEQLNKRAEAAGLSASSGGGKSNEEIAREVWQGKWGNGQDRINRLTSAGYNYWAIQALVDQGVGR